MKDVIKNGTLVFEINNGIKRFMPCKVNMETRRIFNCDIKMMFEGVDVLDDEYLLINGEIHGATGISSDWQLPTDFLYNDL